MLEESARQGNVANMSLQYRAEHGRISLNTAVLSESSNASLRPLLYSSVISQAPGLYVDGGFVGQSLQTTYGAGKMINIGSPISPLSPQQSSPSSDTYSHLRRSLDQHCSSDIYTWTDNPQSCCLHCKGSSLQSQSSVYEGMPYHIAEAPFQISSPFEGRSSSSHNSLQDCPSESYSVQSMEQSGSDDSQTSVKYILQELETALMGPDCDDTDVTGFVSGVQSGAQKGEWLDTLDSSSKESQYPVPLEEQENLRSDRFSYPGNQQHMNSSAPSLDNLAISEKETQIAPQNYSFLPNVQPFQTNSGLEYVGKGSAVEQLLVMCAAAIAENDFGLADIVMARLKQAVSIYGAPIQRLAAYMAEGLVARIASSGQGIYKVLKCKEAPAVDLLSAMQKMYEICPYFKFGYMAANGAIAEAFKEESKVHIIDCQIAFGTQWISLIQALASRPGGPPCVRITGVDDPESEFAATGGLRTVGQRLGELAKAVGVPFEFHPVPVKMAEMQASMVELRPGEALAVNFTYQLHHMPDESVCVTNPRDRLLRMVRSMNPKVLTLVEQEANTNTSSFFLRFMETLSYYSAIFESIDVALPRDSKDRVNVEQQCLARDIVNVIACESAERVERHELMGKWRARMMMAGFTPYPLSSYVNNTIKTLLELYNENYRLKEEGGALFLGWLDRSLVVASAWH